MSSKRKRSPPWSFKAGEYGCSVTVFERGKGGPLYARAWDKSLANGKGGWRRLSLGHKDREEAKKYALLQAVKLQAGTDEIMSRRLSVARMSTLYLRHRTPRKSQSEQQADGRKAKLWIRWLGGDKDPSKITLRDWETFCDARGAGSIDAYGESVPVKKRQPVRARTIEADLMWLNAVLNWCCKWRDSDGRYLLSENPVRGYEMPSEKNVRRPIATQDRYEALRAVSDDVSMENRWQGRRDEQRSYLSELLDIANGTGRRISAVCSLQYDDLKLDLGPYGSIRWRAETDKTGRETMVPIDRNVRAAVDRILAERPGVGAAYLFPSPNDPSLPVRRERASAWLCDAEKLAGLPKLKGGIWHPFRRKWATERKHLPDVDVAAAGGWSGLESLKQAYQQADDATMLQVVLNAGELRERKA